MRRALTVAVVLCLATPIVATATRADLARARTLYNERQFDAAIAFAELARQTPATADAAAVVLARSHLERYRERVDPADLAAARAALAVVRPVTLESRDQVEFLLASGASLFLEDEFGAAAELFESGLVQAQSDPLLRDSMLDWWASAVERHAAGADRELRVLEFTRLGERMLRELQSNPGSAPAGYWVVVAARGSGDAQLAWSAAVASWVRARLAGEHAAMLRADLDRLVQEGIIPDRVRPMPADQRTQAELDLRAEWELIKQKWQ
ncbi:MAG: hypothetical protein LC791_02675 [Acidobacteria bacterium]|nr:hypothetical protein [Acidobacteriota bacterium]